MENINSDEQSYFKYTMESLERSIDYYQQELREIPKRHTKALQGDAFLVESLMSIAATKLKKLELAKGTPYYGRIDFLSDENNNLARVYIGKTDINGENGEQVVTDWRAPICSLYYDSNLGLVSYDAPMGKITGNLKLKRQIIIKNGELIDVLDTSIVSEDELLFPYLNVNADNKMKTIVASIQKEQNEIIRRPLSDNIIVQGVAGSGKTSVALHRIAYLIYSLKETLKSNQFMILGPNKYFLEYISYILPELETEPVEQKTFFELTKDILNEKINFISENELFATNSINQDLLKKVQLFKSSMECKVSLERFMQEYLNGEIVSDGFNIDNQEVYSKELVQKVLFLNNELNFEYACKYFISSFKNNIDDIYEKLNAKYREIYISGLSSDNPIRKNAVEKSVELKNMIKNDGVKLIKEYFKKMQLGTLNTYKLFIENLEKYTNYFSETEVRILKEQTLKLLKQKKVCFTDLPSLLYINTLLCNKKFDYKHIVVDEAQDYGMFHFDILKTLFPNCTFSIYGDLAQSIYSYRSIDDWESVIDTIFLGRCEKLSLNKSYRTTTEITNNANKILEYMNLSSATPVIRHGNEIVFTENAKNIDYKISKIYEYLEKGYKTIAIICKEEKESVNVYKGLINRGINVTHVTDNQTNYNGQVMVLTSALSKGLEFDAVIINDASDSVYSCDSKSDMHLLYVASTRALHELEILYDKHICSALNITNTCNNNDSNKHILKKDF